MASTLASRPLGTAKSRLEVRIVERLGVQPRVFWSDARDGNAGELFPHRDKLAKGPSRIVRMERKIDPPMSCRLGRLGVVR